MPVGHRISDEERFQIKDLHEQGVSAPEIGRRMEIKAGTVSALIRRCKARDSWDAQPRGECLVGLEVIAYLTIPRLTRARCDVRPGP